MGSASWIAFVVALIALILFAVVYIVLFVQLRKVRSRLILGGLEDQEIKDELFRDYGEALKKNSEQKFSDFYKKKKNHERHLDYLANALAILIAVISLAGLTFSLVSRGLNNQVNLNGTTLLIVPTDSMEEKAVTNDYLVKYDLDNQIQSGSLIAVEEKETYEVFDVLAFNVDGVTYVHRLILIEEENGETLYTFRGDANPTSLLKETRVRSEQIIGKWNGFQNETLGLWIMYLQSGIGIISLVLAFAVVTVYSSYYNKISRLKAERYEFYLPHVDELYRAENARRIANGEPPLFEASHRRNRKEE